MLKFKFNKNTSKHKASQYSFKLITVDNQFFLSLFVTASTVPSVQKVKN